MLSWKSGLVGAGVIALLLVASGCKEEAEPPRSTGEPSPNVDVRAGATRFAPMVWLGDGEENMPMDASRYVASASLWFDRVCRPSRFTDLVTKDVDEARLGGHGGAYTTAGCKGKTFSSDKDTDGGYYGGAGFYLNSSDAADIRRGDGPDAPVYWQYYKKDDGRTTAYVYWLFYGYNNFLNKHEGDWERVGVQLVDGKPDALTFWKHNDGPCRVKWPDAEQVDDHPVAYAAAGSHGSYPHPGHYTVNTVGTDVTSAGTRWSTWNTARPVVDQPWWGYKGYWGEQIASNGFRGPRGPYQERTEAVFPEQECSGSIEDEQHPTGEVPDTDVPAVDGVPHPFQGRWLSSEPADQPTSDKTYSVDLTLRDGAVGERVGDIRYPGLDCSGSLTLVEARADELKVAEHIDSSPKDPCTIDGVITLTPTTEGLHFEYVRSSEPDTVTVWAELAR